MGQRMASIAARLKLQCAVEDEEYRKLEHELAADFMHSEFQSESVLDEKNIQRQVEILRSHLVSKASQCDELEAALKAEDNPGGYYEAISATESQVKALRKESMEEAHMMKELRLEQQKAKELFDAMKE